MVQLAWFPPGFSSVCVIFSAKTTFVQNSFKDYVCKQMLENFCRKKNFFHGNQGNLKAKAFREL